MRQRSREKWNKCGIKKSKQLLIPDGGKIKVHGIRVSNKNEAWVYGNLFLSKRKRANMKVEINMPVVV
jgi:hypothetical protein